MGNLKEPECLTLAEALHILQRHVSAGEAKSRLRKAFVNKAFLHSKRPAMRIPTMKPILTGKLGQSNSTEARAILSDLLARGL